MKSKVTARRYGFYVIRLSELQKLWMLAQQEVGTAAIMADCADETERTFHDWEDFANYENVTRKQIVETFFPYVFREWRHFSLHQMEPQFTFSYVGCNRMR